MLRLLQELLWTLRRDGFAISTAQAIDAARVCELVGFADKRTLREALGAVIVERRDDLERYRASFDAFFAPDQPHPGDLWGRLRGRGFTDDELSALRELLEAAAQHSQGDSEAFVALAGPSAELDRLLAAARITRMLAPMTSTLQAGFFAQRIAHEIGIGAVGSAVARIRQALREALGEERGGALGAALAEELESMRRRVRSYVESAHARRIEPVGGPRRSLLERPFTSLSEVEIDEVRRAVRTLAERLRGGERVRRRRARRGRIDPRRTLRDSLRTGGVPFRPARRVRRRDKPCLFILCDISDSVRLASRFMLEFVYAAQELFSGTRSFVFVSDIGETTALFDGRSAAAVLAAIWSGRVVNVAENSNYGRALRTFEELARKQIDRRATIVILGDGRSNYLPEEAALVRSMRDRCRALLWICPEGQDTWGQGDSAMPRYAAGVTKVLVARTAKELERAAREVVARRK